MPVLEIALVPYKQTLTKEHIDAAWVEPEKMLKATPGMLALYTGYMTTHPGILSVFVIWDTIHSHHKMEHSAAYGPFVAGVKPFLSGPIEMMHFEIMEAKELKLALESPITQVSHLHVGKGQVAPFLEGYHAGLKKYIVGEKYKGITMMYPYEDPFSFCAFAGWEREQDHYDVMKKEKYGLFREGFKEFLDPEKGVKIYHAELRKVHGDW